MIRMCSRCRDNCILCTAFYEEAGMITICDFGWRMEINISLIIHWIATNKLKENGYTLKKARTAYKLILRYADQVDIDAMEDHLKLMPKVAEKLKGKKKK